MRVGLWRELRAKETQIFLLALTIGTAAITAPALLAERLNQGVRGYTAELLGADARLESPLPVDEELLAAAANYGLTTARSIETPSVIYNLRTEAFHLVSLSAVTANFPLRGDLLISEDLAGEAAPARAPGPGEIWLDTRAAQLLAAAIGDQMEVGETSLRFTAYLRQEPGRASFFSFAPRAMMNLADIEASRLVFPGSRLEYHYLWSGEKENMRTYMNRVVKEKTENQELIRAGEEDEDFVDLLRRLNSFLLLSGSLTVILAALALVLTTRYYLDENARYVALLKTLGYTPRQVLLYLARRLLPPAFAAYLLGCLLGWLGYVVISQILAAFLPAAESGLLWQPFALGLVSVLICLSAFALPNLAELVNVAPNTVLRSRRINDATQLMRGKQTTLLTTAATGGGIFTLILLYSGNLIITLSLLGGLIGLILLTAAINYGILRFSFARLSALGVVWRIGLSSLYRNWHINSLQILAFAMTFMLIGVLAVMRISLVNDWQTVIKPGTPNNFLINIAPAEVDALQQFMTKRTIRPEPFSGMVRGKLVRVNGESLIERTKRLGTYSSEAEREFNLSWSSKLPTHNLLEAGTWWQPITEKSEVYPVSIENGIAQEFGLSLNDELEFIIGGVTLKAYLANTREVDWGDFKPNFYVLFPPLALEDFPRTFITSFYVPPEQSDTLRDLVKTFPTISLISVDSILKQMAAIFNLVSNAMQLILFLGVVAAIAVFFATLQVSIRLRSITTATLRLIGESNRQAMLHNLLEFCFLGLVGGILAAVGTEIVIYCVYRFLLEQEFSPHGYLILAPILGVLLAGCAGFVWCRQAIIISPQRLLKKVL